jgi:hypothetical protein
MVAIKKLLFVSITNDRLQKTTDFMRSIRVFSIATNQPIKTPGLLMRKLINHDVSPLNVIAL